MMRSYSILLRKYYKTTNSYNTASFTGFLEVDTHKMS